MRMSDWSADWCSSDLGGTAAMAYPGLHQFDGPAGPQHRDVDTDRLDRHGAPDVAGQARHLQSVGAPRGMIGLHRMDQQADGGRHMLFGDVPRAPGMGRGHEPPVVHRQEIGLPPSVFSRHGRSEEHTTELQSPMSISYAAFCSKKKI